MEMKNKQQNKTNCMCMHSNKQSPSEILSHQIFSFVECFLKRIKIVRKLLDKENISSLIYIVAGI